MMIPFHVGWFHLALRKMTTIRAMMIRMNTKNVKPSPAMV